MKFFLVFLFSFLLLAVSGCGDDKSNKKTNNDKDTTSDSEVLTDKDTPPDQNQPDDSNIPDKESIPDKEIITDLDSFPDKDTAQDSDKIENTDDGYCPELSKAKFPYYTNGKIHFCRPCDLKDTEARKKDPECIFNLWKENNARVCKEAPESDCCGYPCQIKILPYGDEYGTICDGEICNNSIPGRTYKGETPYPGAWAVSGPQEKLFSMSGGKIGMYTFHSSGNNNAGMMMEMDIQSKTHTIYGPSLEENSGFYKSTFTTTLPNYNIKDVNLLENYDSYILYYSKNLYRLIYPRPVKAADEIRMNDKWVFANIRETEDTHWKNKVSYAKIGEWKWHTLGEESDFFAWGHFIVDNRYTFQYLGYKSDNLSSVYYCDLDKYPDSVNHSGCKRVSKSGEYGYGAMMDMNNKNRIIYTTSNKMIIADVGGSEIKYEELKPAPSHASETAEFTRYLPQQLRGNMLLYSEEYWRNNAGIHGNITCFYRFDQKKSYCTPETENGYWRQAWGEFEGHYFVYQGQYQGMNIRYMECLCDIFDDQCPFKDYEESPYTPQPEKALCKRDAAKKNKIKAKKKSKK